MTISNLNQIHMLKTQVCGYDEWGFDTGLTDEVYEWMADNVGEWGREWQTSECWFFEDWGMTDILFSFKDPNHAMLFKLTWA